MTFFDDITFLRNMHFIFIILDDDDLMRTGEPATLKCTPYCRVK